MRRYAPPFACFVFAAVVALPAAAQDRRTDEHSYAQPTQVRITHLDLDLGVDFGKRQLAGTATLELDWADGDHDDLVLDTRDLAIATVEARNGKRRWKQVPFVLAPEDARFGSKLTIDLPRQYEQVRIAYTTSPEASGLQWLAPSMTASGKPFMFSQSQAIHARSWVPLQDTPSVRFTYDAHITTPEDTMALMSADNDPEAVRDGDYTFTMPQPIPSYLMAIAAGDLVFKPISERAGVWTEPQTIDRAVAEFADTEKMIQVAEALYGKERADMEFVNSRNGLKAELEDVPAEQQVLMLPMRGGSDPEDALGAVAYDKGAWFLQFLEQRFGRAVFDPFLRSWFDTHAFQSVDSEQFLAFLRSELMARHPGVVTDAEVTQWLTAPGIPAFAPQTVSPRFAAVDAVREDWLKRRAVAAQLDTGKWTTQEWVYFLEGMPDTLDPERLVELDQAFHFTGTGNGEIAQRWYPLTVRSEYFEARPAISLFLRRIGRRKLIMPTYEALVATPEGLAFATQVFAMARPGYHPITTGSVEALLAKAKAAPAE